jgi:imidazolonepropionase-like amidohydrolase
MRRPSVALSMILASLAALFAAAPTRATEDTYIRSGQLLDVRNGKMLTNQIIVIHADKIASISPASQIQIPTGANVIDLSHSTVLPGLIDCHTHIMLADTDDSHYDDILLKQSWQYRTILATLNVKKDLEAGFTAMRDVETEGAMYSDVDVRNAINGGLIPGPRLKVATRGISTTGGYGLEGYSPEVTVPIGVQIIDGPWEARKAVREQFNYGADLIKIYGTDRYSFTPDGKAKSRASPTSASKKPMPSSTKPASKASKSPATPTTAPAYTTASMPA